jgi:hypothetical protein
MPPRDPAPRRHFVERHVTPLKVDVLFWELRDSRHPAHRVGAYGDAHPNTTLWPNHVLVFISTADEDGWEQWWYAADRASQDTYNAEIKYPLAGDPAYPRITRTYIIPRATYAALNLGDLDPVFGNPYYMVDQEVGRIGQEELDSRYVVAIRVFEKIPGYEVIEDATDDVFCLVKSYRRRVLTTLPYTLPTLGSSYGAGVVVGAKFTPLNALSGEYDIRVAVFPISKSTNRADDTFCEVTVQETYNLTSAFGALPATGDTVSSKIVIGAGDEEVMCNITKRTLTLATLPVEKETQRTDDTFCEVTIQETYDETSEFGALPATGDLVGPLTVISAGDEEVMCNLTKRTVTLATLPVEKVFDRLDDTFCSVKVKEIYDRTADIGAIPASGSTVTVGIDTYYVLDAEDTEAMCNITRRELVLIELPHSRFSETTDKDFDVIAQEELYDLTSALGSLPLPGDTYSLNSTDVIVLSADDNEIACGITKRTIRGVDKSLFPICGEIVGEDHPEFCKVLVETCYRLADLPHVYPTLVCLDIDYREDEVSPGIIRTVRKYLLALPPDRVSQIQDPETGETIEVTVSYSCTGTSANMGQPYYDVSIEPITCRLFRITTSYLDGLPAALVEYQTVSFAYPPVHNFTTVGSFTDAEGVGHFSVYHDITPGETRQVIARVDTTYHATVQIPTAVDRPELVTVDYRGVLFEVRLDDVITAGDTLVANTASNDRKWGYGVESFTYPASGTQTWPPVGGAVVDGDCTRWKFNLFRKRVVTVLGTPNNPVAGPP